MQPVLIARSWAAAAQLLLRSNANLAGYACLRSCCLRESVMCTSAEYPFRSCMVKKSSYFGRVLLSSCSCSRCIDESTDSRLVNSSPCFFRSSHLVPGEASPRSCPACGILGCRSSTTGSQQRQRWAVRLSVHLVFKNI